MKCPLCNGTGDAHIGFEAKPSTEIGRILKEAREKRGLSLRNVEAATGISNALISQVETGQIKSPSFKSVMRLCDVYGIKPQKLNSIEDGSANG